MLRSNIPEFKAEARKAIEDMREQARDKLVRLAAEGYERLVRNTEESGSVDTGATRAEHVIEQNGRPVFEHPDRVGPDRHLDARKAFGLPPLIDAVDLSEVLDALRSNLELGNVRFVNRRFTIDWLENGNAQIEPRRIYAGAAAYTEGAAARIGGEIA